MKTESVKAQNKIDEAQKKLKEAKEKREINKIRYDTQVVIMEGQRRTLADLERMNQELMNELMRSNDIVSDSQIELQNSINVLHNLEENESESGNNNL